MLAGPDSIIGRSVVLTYKVFSPSGATGDENLDEPVACGTIGTAIYDTANIDLLPEDAAESDGTTACV